ncbi:MAG: cell division protein FtsQ/DivIB [Acetivibrionales bacterium]|jgi:cell division protein FtsQ
MSISAYERNIRRKKGKKFKRTIKWIKSLLVFILFGVTVVLMAYSPLFNIKVIEVRGNAHYEASEIIDMLDISTGSNAFKCMGKDITNIFTFRYNSIEEKIEKNCSYIKEAKVQYYPPSKVLVDIKERNPVGIVPYLGTSIIIDEEGYIVDTVKTEEEHSLPVIKGIVFDNYELGQRIKVQKNPESVRNAIEVIETINSSDEATGFKLYSIIESIDVSNQEKICLFMDSRLVVNLGDLEDLRYRINVLKHIYLNNIKEDDKGLIDFTVGENPVFIPEK